VIAEYLALTEPRFPLELRLPRCHFLQNVNFVHWQGTLFRSNSLAEEAPEKDESSTYVKMAHLLLRSFEDARYNFHMQSSTGDVSEVALFASAINPILSLYGFIMGSHMPLNDDFDFVENGRAVALGESTVVSALPGNPTPGIGYLLRTYGYATCVANRCASDSDLIRVLNVDTYKKASQANTVPADRNGHLQLHS